MDEGSRLDGRREVRFQGWRAAAAPSNGDGPAPEVAGRVPEVFHYVGLVRGGPRSTPKDPDLGLRWSSGLPKSGTTRRRRTGALRLSFKC